MRADHVIALEDHQVVVLASRELLQEMPDWGDPVQVRAQEMKDGTWEFVFRRLHRIGSR